MANYEQLKQAVADVIKSNGNQEITGAILQNALLSIISTVGSNATFAGIAIPTTSPGTPDQNVFYFAVQAGTYINFGGLEIKGGFNIIKNNTSGNWVLSNVYELVQELGDSETAVISQKAVTTELVQLYKNLYGGNVVKNTGVNVAGTLVRLTDYYVTDYIPYIQGNDVTWNFGIAVATLSNGQLCAYAADKTTRVDGFNMVGDGERIIPASSLTKCVYIRATFHKSQLNSTIISFGNYSFVSTIGSITELNTNIIALKQRINVSKCTSLLSSVLEGEYFYNVSVNSFCVKTAPGSFERINVPLGLVYYKEQFASFNGEKYVASISPIDELSKIDIKNLHYTNNQVNATNGKLSRVNPARLCSELVTSMGLDITIQDGYHMYLYMYDMDGNYLGYNESNNTGRFILSFPFNCKLRLVFMHSDKTTNILSINGVISSCIGLYNYDITSDNIKEVTKSGIFVIEDLSAKLPICNVMRGNNVFDYSSIVANKIRNDSGDEVTDTTSEYLSQLIPAFGGVYLNSSVQIQRVYYLGINGEWIGRQFIYNTKYIVPSEYSGQTVYYIQLQFKTANISNNNVVTLGKFGYKEIGEDNIQFATNPNGLLYDNTSNIVWKNDFGEIDYYAFISKWEINISEDLTDISPWEPDSVDSGYSNPETGSGRNTNRSDWTATDKYKYYDFLAHYYDGYVGETDLYKVSKRMLFQSGQCNGHEVYEYDFCPINYKYVIMLSAGMNANETQGIWGLATFIRCLMGEEEPVLASIKEKVRFKVIPIINAAGFDYDSPLKYGYVESREDSTEVNPNFNFNYKTSWEDNTATWSYKGLYPDSCIETQGLKNWINEHSGKAIFWADLHTGRWENGYSNKTILDLRFGSLPAYYAEFNSVHVPLIKQFYINKGYITASDNIGGAINVRDNVDYQKHRYAVDNCKIESCMPEMHIESSGYGTDGLVNNSPLGIKAYVLQIRQLVIYALNKYVSEHMILKLPQQDVESLQNRF